MNLVTGNPRCVEWRILQKAAVKPRDKPFQWDDEDVYQCGICRHNLRDCIVDFSDDTPIKP